MKSGKKIPLTEYLSENVTGLARFLLGKYLYTHIDGQLCGGIITETEAYAGITDKASHAYGGRRTARTEVMYGSGGRSYVYFTYGMHHLFNVVTAPEGIPHAVLIRALQPAEGLDVMMQRRNRPPKEKNLANGPAKLCQALGITLEHNNLMLDGDLVWIEDRGLKINSTDIITAPRIGVDYAGEDAKLPYRFYVTKRLG